MERRKTLGVETKCQVNPAQLTQMNAELGNAYGFDWRHGAVKEEGTSFTSL